MYSKFGQFIDGKWQTSKETYEVINPATEEIIGKVSKASSTDVEKVLKVAQKGFDIWKKTEPWQRSYIIRKIADVMRKKNEVLAKWLTLEVGKPLAEGKGEAGGSADIFEWNSEETKRIYGQTVESRFEDTRVHVYYQPVGVVAALVPWNFPLILASRKISTALAAGCSVICKPDVITPGTVMELVEICREAGVPPGVVNLLSGDPPSIASQLIASDIVKKISITGSTRVGKLILKQAAEKVQRVTMELSGHAPFIVFDDANLEKATDMAIAAKFRNNGQVCISPSKFYIQNSKKKDFVNLMKGRGFKVLKVVKEGLKEFAELDVVIVDTAGRHALDEELISEMKSISKIVKPDEILLVMDATVGQQAGPQAQAFHDAVGVSGVILTKLDGSAKGGGALSAVAVTKAPIVFVGTGESLDSLETLDPDRFISRLLGMGDLQTLLERAEEVLDAESAEDTARKMLSGKFTLIDMQEQMEALTKMGPLSKVMEMVPGMSGMMKKGQMDETQDKLEKFKDGLIEATEWMKNNEIWDEK